MATLEELEALVDKLNVELTARTAVLEMIASQYVLEPLEAKRPGTIANQFPAIEEGLRARSDMDPELRDATIAVWRRLITRINPKRPWQADTLPDAIVAAVFELKEWWKKPR